MTNENNTKTEETETEVVTYGSSLMSDDSYDQDIDDREWISDYSYDQDIDDREWMPDYSIYQEIDDREWMPYRSRRR